MRTASFWQVLGIAVFFLLPTISGCQSILDSFVKSFGSSVVIPSSDNTPPAVSLTVPDPQKGNVVLVPGAAGYSRVMSKDEQLFIVGAAEDPQGVKFIEIFGEARVQCESNIGVGQLRIFSLRSTDTDDSVPGGTGLTRRWIPFNVNASRYASCADPQTFHATGVSVTLQARGANFHGPAVITPTAVFTYRP